MVGVSTVALIERKPNISRNLFSRYWRDVHGVMAARIPGFQSYTQYHVTPLDPATPPFEGVAIVTFACEEQRAGLATSEVTKHIHRDEQNVFARALLYNLGEDARTTHGRGDRTAPFSLFEVVPEGLDITTITDTIGVASPTFCDRYDLRDADPAGWNDTNVGSQRFVGVFHSSWKSRALRDAAGAALRELGSFTYFVDEVHLMVDSGVPTPTGLRGLDAVRTINEIGASNQLTEEVAVAIYGSIASPLVRRRALSD